MSDTEFRYLWGVNEGLIPHPYRGDFLESCLDCGMSVEHDVHDDEQHATMPLEQMISMERLWR